MAETVRPQKPIQERLRERKLFFTTDRGVHWVQSAQLPDHECKEAADLIDTLIKERDEARARAAAETRSSGQFFATLCMKSEELLDARSKTIEECRVAARVGTFGDVSAQQVLERVDAELRALLPPTAPDSEVHNDAEVPHD